MIRVGMRLESAKDHREVFSLDTETREFLLSREIMQRRSGFGDVRVKTLSFKATYAEVIIKKRIRSQNLTTESVAEPHGDRNREWALHQRLLLNKVKLSQVCVVTHLCLSLSRLCFFSQTRFLCISMHMTEDGSFLLYRPPVQPE